MTPSDEFWVDVRRAQDEALRSSSAVARVRDAMPLRAEGRKNRWPVALAAAALLLALGGGIVAATGSAPPSLAFTLGEQETPGRVGAWLAAEDSALRMRFSEGTVLSLDPGSRARVVELQADGAHVVLERGKTSASVVHRKHARWRLDAGPFRVDVVGTRFRLEWDPATEKLEVVLESGAVLVGGSFLEEPIRVAEGQKLTASCREERAELVGARSAESSRVEQRAAVSAVAPSAAAELTRPPVERWQSLATRGKYREALAFAIRLGFDAECRRASGDDLVLLGDAARLSGDIERAKTAYHAARRSPGSAGRATYALGLVAFDQQRNFTEAGKWFKTYLTENPNGGLRREAMGRLIEARQRAGDASGAKATAREYLSSYPSGSYARLARELVSR